jgi:hypothetical protein
VFEGEKRKDEKNRKYQSFHIKDGSRPLYDAASTLKV